MLTVIFATRNGARTLPHVLAAYCKLKAPPGGWKLIVVDNGSTDGSHEIVASFQHKLPLTTLSEQNPGKNVALNSALPKVEGDLVVFTDDDALPDPDWLTAMRAAADAAPAYALFGGVVVPHWERKPPDWVLNWVPPEPVYTLTPPSLGDGPMDHQFAVGPNMAVRKSVFDDGFRFDPTIGPQGESYAMGSELEFVKRLARHGYEAWHVRNARVAHFIRDFQMTRAWVLRRAIRLGRGLYRIGRMERGVEMPAWRGVPRYLYRDLIRQAGRLVTGVLTFRGETVFRAQWELNVIRGQILEASRTRSR